MKRQPPDWEEIFANDMTNKGLIFKIYKQLIKLNIQKYLKNLVKNGQKTGTDSCQRRYTDGQLVHEKMFNIANHQRNANQNHNEISPHTCQNGYHQKVYMGFPGGTVVESLPANAGDTGLSPGLGRSHMPRSSWAREPQLLSLRVWSLCSATREAATVKGPRNAMKSDPHLPQLEKALAQK